MHCNTLQHTATHCKTTAGEGEKKMSMKTAREGETGREREREREREPDSDRKIDRARDRERDKERDRERTREKVCRGCWRRSNHSTRAGTREEMRVEKMERNGVRQRETKRPSG